MQVAAVEPGEAGASSLLELLACPRCGAPLAEPPPLRCTGCGAVYAIEGGIPDLRAHADPCSETVRAFYAEAPFPGYGPHPTLGALRARAARSALPRLLDEAIPRGARVVEIGCGTGQTSLFLASGGRTVIGADLTRASLRLAADAALRLGIASARFVETDLLAPGLRRGAFDVVYCSGVLHHTRDPAAAFGKIAELARPGGILVLGLYNRFARLPHRLRRGVARLSRYRFIPFDSVLRDRQREPDRARAWLRDQYQHPEEHRHSIAEVKRWFDAHQVEYLRTYPTALLGQSEAPESPLFAPDSDDWPFEHLLTQLGWIFTLSHEGGLFLTVGRKLGTGYFFPGSKIA